MHLLKTIKVKIIAASLIFISINIYGEPTYRGSNNHNNYYGDIEVAGKGIEWDFRASDRPIDISPIYNEINIFIATTDGHIYSLDKKSGIENWSVKLDTKLTSQLYMHNDSLVVGDDNGSIYIINTDNKKIEKVYNVINERTIMNPFHKNGVIYTTHDKGYICTLVPTLENRIDCYSTKSTFFAGPLLENNLLTLFAFTECCGKELYVFSLEKEFEIQEVFNIGSRFVQMPILVGNHIFSSEMSTQSNSNPFIYSIDTSDGSIKDIFKVKTYAWLSYWNNNIVFGDHTSFYSIDLNGRQKWSIETGRPVVTYPSLTNKYAYLSNHNRIISVDIHTGEKNWELEGDFFISTPLLLDEKRLFFGTRDGRILSIN